jgi:hypothetical protein
MGPMRKRPRTNPPKDQPSNVPTKTSQTAPEEVERIAANIPLPETPVNRSSRDLVSGTSHKDGKSESSKNVSFLMGSGGLCINVSCRQMRRAVGMAPGLANPYLLPKSLVRRLWQIKFRPNLQYHWRHHKMSLVD